MAFTRAIRQKVFLKIAITGPSGSGKTYSALQLAFGLGKRIAFLDTENGSGNLYDFLGPYDIDDIHAPFTVAKYITGINNAVAGGYDVVIIDSLTHAWAADGGLLAQKDARDQRGGNSFSNWGDITKLYEQFKSSILQSPIHVIATMRSKQDYVLETDARGKSTPKKVGLAPVMREGIEYEFTTVFDVDMAHTAATSKDRTGLFTDEIARIEPGHGHRLQAWLEGGAAPAPAGQVVEAPANMREAREYVRQPYDAPVQRKAEEERRNGVERQISALRRSLELKQDAWQEWLSENFNGLKTTADMDIETLSRVLSTLTEFAEALDAPGTHADETPAPESAAPESAAPTLTPAQQHKDLRGAISDILKGLQPKTRDGWQKRFQSHYPTSNMAKLSLEDVEEMANALRAGVWPYEDEFAAKAEGADPFASEPGKAQV